MYENAEAPSQRPFDSAVNRGSPAPKALVRQGLLRPWFPTEVLTPSAQVPWRALLLAPLRLDTLPCGRGSQEAPPPHLARPTCRAKLCQPEMQAEMQAR